MSDVEVVIKTKVLQEERKAEVKRPRLYKVVILNDDYTPMEFVVHILVNFFAISEENATLIMWQVHTAGKGICGIFTRDIAETKVAVVNDFSRQHDHPLKCMMEPDDSN
jgi:ATP-dependent Clp protease adaptor protein ClpS